MSANELPLKGLRVIDSADVKGELAGRLLADFGADVIRVEPPGGAASRRLPPFAPDGDTSLYFAFRNFNKRGITVDVATAEGQARLQELLAGADVWIESSKPGSLAPFGLDPRAVSDRFPHLVVLSVTDFGQEGPYARFEATDEVIQAMSGHLAASGIPEKPPLLIPGAFAYDAAGVVGALAVLIGLVARRRTGRGQHLDLSALEAAIQLNTWQLANMRPTLDAGLDPPIVRSGTTVVYPLFETADGFITMVILSPRQWYAMWEWLGRPEAFADEMWSQALTRMMNGDVLNPVIAEHFATMGMEEAAAEAQRRGVVVTPMLKPSDILVNEHYVSRDTFVPVEVAAGASASVASGFMEINRHRQGFRFPAPAVGQHDADVAGETAPGSPAGPPASEAATGAGPEAQPLAGLRVLDFGHGGVGVEGGRMLAEYGADVIKIETRTYPDFMRLVTGTEMTPSFASSSRTKRSFGVNSKIPEGLAVLKELVKTADIVIENNSTGTMDAMGVGYETLKELNPNVCMASSQLMGSTGAYADWIGYGPTIQTVGGIKYLWNFTDGDPPPGSNAIHPDHLAGRLCALGALAALLGRDERGAGAHAEISQAEALVNTLGDLFMAESLRPGSVQPVGNDSDQGAPWGVFQCAGEQQWCVICVRHDADWVAIKQAMGNPAWADEPRWDTAAGRLADRVAINAGVARWTAGLSPQETQEACQAEGVPGAAMLTALDHLTDPQLAARGFQVEVDQPGAGTLILEGPCFYGSEMPTPPIAPAPLLGEHTREICEQDLGIPPEEVTRLITLGALEIPLDT
ncbi:CaiB/BaiF CoA transferase family protein [Candidatus Poriferisocius sp.]|uniref:CaiB/BaiF CoA transferase family protein n=1 Tax=Candidatus Poriferisocius sp. TaxID=3101276 RepID=UPI003B59DF80